MMTRFTTKAFIDLKESLMIVLDIYKSCCKFLSVPIEKTIGMYT